MMRMPVGLPVSAPVTALYCRSYSVQVYVPSGFSHMPQPHQARIHFTPHLDKHLHFAIQVRRRLVLHVRVHRENGSVWISDVLHVDDHGVLGLGALMPGLAFRSQVEAKPEGSAQAGVHAISSLLMAVLAGTENVPSEGCPGTRFSSQSVIVGCTVTLWATVSVLEMVTVVAVVAPGV